MSPATSFADLEAKVAAGQSFTRADAERLLGSPDLVTIGVLGESARRRKTGDRVTFGRVCAWISRAAPTSRGEAGEVRIATVPSSPGEAHAWVTSAVAFAAGTPVTGFSALTLLELAGHDHLALAALAKDLRRAGLDGVAEIPVDKLGSVDHLIEVVRALEHGGLGACRLTVDVAPPSERLDIIERACALQAETGAIRAFAPLPRTDPVQEPSTGYDDVRTIAVAQLMLPNTTLVQVDWPLYGPKLAQVAIAYGASDIDGVAAEGTAALGARRSPRADIVRQVEAAGATAVERNGRYESLR